MVDSEKFSVFRLGHRFQKSGHMWYRPFWDCTVLCCTVLYCTVLRVAQSVKIFLALYGVRGFITCSQDPGPILYPSQLNPVQILTSYLFKMHLTVIFSLRSSSSESVSKYSTHFPLTYIAIWNSREKQWLHCSFAFRLYSFTHSLWW